MAKVELDAETVDRIVIMGLRNLRDEIAGGKSHHVDDVAADRLRIAAIDVLLCYYGVSS